MLNLFTNYTELITEEINQKAIAQLKAKIAPELTIEGGLVKVWHYSDKLIKGKIQPYTSSIHGSDEFYEINGKKQGQAWFYTNEGGFRQDRNIPTLYKYIAWIPFEQIYPRPPKTDEEFLEMRKYGYTASFGVAGKGATVIKSYIPVKISETYMEGAGSRYASVGKKMKDYPIGTVKMDDGIWYVIQRNEDGLTIELANTYLSKSKIGSGYKRPFEIPDWDKIKLYPEFEGKYKI